MPLLPVSAAVLWCLCCLRGSEARHSRPRLASPHPLASEAVSTDLISRCKLQWFDTNLDHFSRTKGPNNETTFPLRYYVCDEEFRYANTTHPSGPIFFYLGNEADVLLYLNASGLMWENAGDFGAMLMFAEHRYYGQSLPFGNDSSSHMQWLSSEQALADYATLLHHFKEENGLEDAPVIGFGGSYGGMLASWARAKYPHVWQGAIAASAPIWTFYDEKPAMDPLFFSKGVTFDATEAAGAPAGCSEAIRAAFAAMGALSTKGGGPHVASRALRVCASAQLNTTDDVLAAREWAASAFDYMAMGNYPYASSYMLNGNGVLPPFPMRESCTRMMEALAGGTVPLGPRSRRELHSEEDAWRTGSPSAAPDLLLHGLAAAIGVWYNYTGDLACFDPWEGVNMETARVLDFWDYQYCTEQFMPMARSGVEDMFWASPWNETAAREACRHEWAVEPRRAWPTVQWGGHRLSTLTNVVFSNGLYDPWHGGGVLKDLSDSVTAVIIPEGGHHLDLMFSNAEDPQSVKDARQHELEQIEHWIERAARGSS